jgi:cytochrome c553
VKSQVLAAVTAAAVAVPAMIAAPAWAQADAGAARYIAANCANCHGTAGVARGGMPSLAGQKKEQIASRVREFRDGKRAATLMHQIAKGYSDAQIDAIAEEIARQSMAK